MIWVRKTENESGNYVAENGTRYIVEWCVGMITHDGSTPKDHGYTRHESMATAAVEWGLTPYVDPEAQAEFIEAEVIEENS